MKLDENTHNALLATHHLAFKSVPRNPKWNKVRKEHLKLHNFCRSCGGIKNLEVHHIKPFHLFPKLELDPKNLITLCSAVGLECHYMKGHLGKSWFDYNPLVRRQCLKRKAKV